MKTSSDALEKDCKGRSRSGYSSFHRQMNIGVERTSVQSIRETFQTQASCQLDTDATAANGSASETPHTLIAQSQSHIEQLQQNLSTKLKSSTVESLKNSYSPTLHRANIIPVDSDAQSSSPVLPSPSVGVITNKDDEPTLETSDGKNAASTLSDLKLDFWNNTVTTVSEIRVKVTENVTSANTQAIATTELQDVDVEKRTSDGASKVNRVSWTTQLIEKLSEEEIRKKKEPVRLVPNRLVRYPGQKDFDESKHKVTYSFVSQQKTSPNLQVKQKEKPELPQRISKPETVLKRQPQAVNPPESLKEANNNDQADSSTLNDNSKDGYAELINHLVDEDVDESALEEHIISTTPLLPQLNRPPASFPGGDRAPVVPDGHQSAGTVPENSSSFPNSISSRSRIVPLPEKPFPEAHSTVRATERTPPNTSDTSSGAEKSIAVKDRHYSNTPVSAPQKPSLGRKPVATLLDKDSRRISLGSIIHKSTVDRAKNRPQQAPEVPQKPRRSPSGSGPTAATASSERKVVGFRRLFSTGQRRSQSEDRSKQSRLTVAKSEESKPLLKSHKPSDRVFPLHPKPIVETAFLSDSPIRKSASKKREPDHSHSVQDSPTKQNQYNLSKAYPRPKSVSPSRGRPLTVHKPSNARTIPDTSLVLEEKLNQIRRELSPETVGRSTRDRSPSSSRQSSSRRGASTPDRSPSGLTHDHNRQRITSPDRSPSSLTHDSNYQRSPSGVIRDSNRQRVTSPDRSPSSPLHNSNRQRITSPDRSPSSPQHNSNRQRITSPDRSPSSLVEEYSRQRISLPDVPSGRIQDRNVQRVNTPDRSPSSLVDDGNRQRISSPIRSPLGLVQNPSHQRVSTPDRLVEDYQRQRISTPDRPPSGLVQDYNRQRVSTPDRLVEGYNRQRISSPDRLPSGLVQEYNRQRVSTPDRLIEDYNRQRISSPDRPPSGLVQDYNRQRVSTPDRLIDDYNRQRISSPNRPPSGLVPEYNRQRVSTPDRLVDDYNRQRLSSPDRPPSGLVQDYNRLRVSTPDRSPTGVVKDYNRQRVSSPDRALLGLAQDYNRQRASNPSPTGLAVDYDRQRTNAPDRSPTGLVQHYNRQSGSLPYRSPSGVEDGNQPRGNISDRSSPGVVQDYRRQGANTSDSSPSSIAEDFRRRGATTPDRLPSTEAFNRRHDIRYQSLPISSKARLPLTAQAQHIYQNTSPHAYYHSPQSSRPHTATDGSYSLSSSSSTIVSQPSWTPISQAISGSPDIRRLQQYQRPEGRYSPQLVPVGAHVRVTGRQRQQEEVYQPTKLNREQLAALYLQTQLVREGKSLPPLDPRVPGHFVSAASLDNQALYGNVSPLYVRGVPQDGSVQLRRPIFKRGSLVSATDCPSPGPESGQPKRVSFTGATETSSQWPTRNGPAPEPPTRQRPSQRFSEDSDVFLEAPTRPLPPIPGQCPVSESESGSEAGEVQRILQHRTRQEEEWGSDGKGRGPPGSEHSASTGGRDEEVRRGGGGGGRPGRRDEPRRHTLSGDHHQHHQHQSGSLARSMDLEMSSKSQRRKSPLPRGYPPPSTAMLFDDDPGIMSEVETSSTGFRRGGKQRSSLPVVRTPSKTLERPLGLVFLQYRSETKRALLPNEITSIDTVKALFVRSFPKQLTMEYLDSPLVKIYIHDSSKDMFYELEDLRSHLRDIRDRSVLRLFESADMNGGVLPGAGVGVVAPAMWDQDQSYFSEPEFDSEYQHQHIHKTKASSKSSSGGVAPQPYYMTHSYPPGGSQGGVGAPATLPRGGPLLRAYSPAVVPPVPAERMKTLPQTGVQPPPKPVRTYQQGHLVMKGPSNMGPRVPDRIYSSFISPPDRRGNVHLYSSPDRLHSESGYMSSPERGGPRSYPSPYPAGGPGYEDPYYSQYASRSGSITPVIDEEASRCFHRIRVEHMERQLANLTGLVQKALTQTPTPREYLQVPTSTRDANYRNDKSVSFEKSVSFSDEPPDMNSPKQHSPQHTERTERDRHKPAPPPKPVSLSPGQYEGRHVYRDLQLTPEMYNQLRGLQKKAKDLRQEVRNLRRMSQAQAHSVRETIRDTFIKIRAMLLMGGEEAWASAGDADKVRLSREEDSYKQEMIRLEKDLTELESTVEELRGNVINRKTRVNMSDVENMALILSKSSKTVADLKVRFPSLQDGMKGLLSSEMEKVVREEKFLKEEPERLESALRRCKKLTGTLVTLKRLASVQEQRLPPSTTPDARLSPTLGDDSDTPITPPAHGKAVKLSRHFPRSSKH